MSVTYIKRLTPEELSDLRDKFAEQSITAAYNLAMDDAQGNPDPDNFIDRVAWVSYHIADAMLKARGDQS